MSNMMEIDDPATQERNLLREAFEADKITSLKSGQKWFVLSTRWFNKWKDYVDYMDMKEGKSVRPGKIDNKILIDKILDTENIPGLYAVAMKEDLSEPDDYVIISEHVSIHFKFINSFNRYGNYLMDFMV
jgi:hypothetical protein